MSFQAKKTLKEAKTPKVTELLCSASEGNDSDGLMVCAGRWTEGRKRKEGKGRKGREGKGREGKGRDGTGREGKGREDEQKQKKYRKTKAGEGRMLKRK